MDFLKETLTSTLTEHLLSIVQKRNRKCNLNKQCNGKKVALLTFMWFCRTYLPKFTQVIGLFFCLFFLPESNQIISTCRFNIK